MAMPMESNLPIEENKDALEQGNDLPLTNVQPKEEKQTNEPPVEGPKKDATSTDLSKLAIEEYPAELQKLTKHPQWSRMGDQIRQLSNAFNNAFDIRLKQKKETFIAEGGNEIDFQFTPQYRTEFLHLLREYKQKKQQHYKEIETAQKNNLNRKREIIEGIKQLVDSSVQDQNSYKQFKHLQEAFHSTGQVPRNEVNNIWETYKFHVERYYDFLHLNRDLREADFKHNYTEKVKIIERAEVLTEMPDIVSAIRELNSLHRLWKNELGPVAKEHREALWSRFQNATKIIHQRRNEYNKNIESIQAENLVAKKDLLNQIENLIKHPPKNHSGWQKAIKKSIEIREQFNAIGPTAKKEKNNLWNSYRSLFRTFNQEKNNFYKTQKAEERVHVGQKQALIDEIKSILDRDDWREQSQRVIQLQKEWKKTGRISHRRSKKMWNDFREAINLYFDRLKNKTTVLNEAGKMQLELLEKFVDRVKKLEAPKTPKKLEQFIDEQLAEWEDLSAVVGSTAETKLMEYLTKLWDATSLSAKEKASQKFMTQLALKKSDGHALDKEYSFLKKKIDEISAKVIQLQNNLQFFSSSSNENPMVLKVNKEMEQLLRSKSEMQEKANTVKSLKRSLTKKKEISEQKEDSAAE